MTNYNNNGNGWGTAAIGACVVVATVGVGYYLYTRPTGDGGPDAAKAGPVPALYQAAADPNTAPTLPAQVVLAR